MADTRGPNGYYFIPNINDRHVYSIFYASDWPVKFYWKKAFLPVKHFVKASK